MEKRLAQGCAFRSPSNQRSHTTTPATTYTTPHNTYILALPVITIPATSLLPSLPPHHAHGPHSYATQHHCLGGQAVTGVANCLRTTPILLPHHGRRRCHDLERLRRIIHRGQHPVGLRRRCETLRDHRFTGPQAGRLLYHNHAPASSQPEPSTRTGQGCQEHRHALPRGLP